MRHDSTGLGDGLACDDLAAATEPHDDAGVPFGSHARGDTDRSRGSRVTRLTPRGNPRVWWCAAIAITLVTSIASIALSGHRRHDPHLDVFDEGSHYAYVVALRSGHIPAWGDTLNLSERKLDDCLQSVGAPPAPCGSRPAPAST